MTDLPAGPRDAGGPLVSRRSFLRGATAAAGLTLGGAALSACSSAVVSGLSVSHPAPGSLDYWDLFGGGDGVRMKAMEDGFRKANPNIGLTAVTLAWGNPYYTKLSLATLGKKPPGVAVSHLTRMKNLVTADLLEELRLEDLTRHGITPDKLDKRAWETGLVNGKAYAVPLDTHPFVLFYNTDVCKKAGLLDADGKLPLLKGENALTDALERTKKVTGGYGGVVAINNEIATPWRMFSSLYAQLGGQMLADQGTRVVIDDGKAMQALRFMQSLTKTGLMPSSVDYQGSIAMFANGQAAFLFQGEWEITTFQTAKMPFSMTLFPNVFGGDRYAVQADSHTLVVPKQAKQDAGRLDRSLRFIRSMLDQSQTWAEGGHVPTWLPFRDSPEFAKLTPQANYAAAAEAAAYDPEGWYSGSGSNFEIITGSAIGAVMSGQQSPEAALSQMRTSLGKLAATPSPIL
jgi:multiple sugar transport system substrate-binding protein